MEEGETQGAKGKGLRQNNGVRWGGPADAGGRLPARKGRKRGEGKIPIHRTGNKKAEGKTNGPEAAER